MAILDELAIGLGRVVASQIKGAKNAVLLSLKFLEASEDDDDSGEAHPEEPYYRSLGMYGRPRPAVKTADATANNPEGEAEVIAAKLDDRAYTLAFRDLRIDEKLNPKDGEVGIGHYLGGFISFKVNDDGDGTNIQIYAPHQDGSGTPDKAHAISMDSTAGNSSISIMAADGQSIAMTKEGSVIISSADGSAFIEVKNGDLIISGASISFPGGALVGATVPGDGFPAWVNDPLFITFLADLIAGFNVMAAAFNIAGPLVGAPGTILKPVLIPPVPSTKLSAAL
ncbi:MAG: hypothetical protein V3W41_22065 [Planctomycetota bacterium]